jgi:multidrug efflux pump subunit AcrA (membrane-fusion protein)
MTEETIDPGLLEQTKNQIRKLVAEIAELAEADIQPAEFHAEFLTRVVAAVAASGGALWLLDGKGGLKLQHQLEFRLTGLMDGRVRSQPHDALLGCMIQATQPQIIPPGAAVEGVPNAGNPTSYSLIISPLLVDKQVVGMVEILMDPTRRAATQKSTLRFVSDLCDLAGQYLKNRQMRQMMSQQRLWNQLEGFTHTIHGTLDLKETAYSVANDGKRLVGCDRVSVALKLAGRVRVEAISGQEIVEQRANLVRELTRLCKVVIQSGEDLVYTGNTEAFPPDIRDALEIYVDESGSKAVAISLLHKPDTEDNKDKVPYGCLVAEQIGDELASTDMHARTEVVSRHASTALWNAQEYDKIFLRPMLKAIGSPMRFFRGRTLAKILAVIGLILGTIGVLAFVPWELTIEGRGSLLPENRRTIYAPFQGIVNDVLVEHGSHVHKGDLLLRLDSRDLQKDLKRLSAEYSGALTEEIQLRNKMDMIQSRPEERSEVQAQMEAAEVKAKGAFEQIEVLKEQLALMDIHSPQDGMITTWEVKKNLAGRPVEVGQELLHVSDTDGEWVLEVDVPDDDMGPVLDAESKLEREIAQGRKDPSSTLAAYFVMATDPEHRYPGYVRRIAAKAETVEGKHVVKVTVGFTDKVRAEFLANHKGQEPLRPGAEVRARVKCGKARLAYVLLRDVVHVWYETILFRWPFMR